ncbi:carboxymuconolactone decarboxylase family protein [Sabulicella glaciei]|uniref:Carboxymuconolactone decarboxylase family protein n=1 Tax=Sabulicella glaciei TaxID=2984948 RepID=A0ABT3NZL6_9PROT|nr:carboxymuconolactone decarboxylase family protein [Roseococcus sp. MDT2-1-1]MCW8087571.1 carboxymuconolactone decarboxylase family protein [Roseococcus sp. MDT2-1-1]
MPRLDLPPEETMSLEQREACAEAVAGVRGRVPAPMIAWIRNAEFARRGQKLGELLRYHTTLEPALSELAILVCARHWTSHHEWTAHKREGLKAGITPEVVASIAARREPALPDERARAVYDVSRTLLATGRVPAPLYASALAALGERGLVELVGILGYYCLVALTLNTFELGLPGSFAPELEEAA